MSSDAAAADESGSLQDRVLARLQNSLPDDLHRGATVEAADPETGTVALSFGCGCSGGLAPQQQALLRTALVEELPTVERVTFQSGCGCGSGGGQGRGTPRGGRSSAARSPSPDDDGPEAPF